MRTWKIISTIRITRAKFVKMGKCPVTFERGYRIAVAYKVISQWGKRPRTVVPVRYDYSLDWKNPTTVRESLNGTRDDEWQEEGGSRSPHLFSPLTRLLFSSFSLLSTCDFFEKFYRQYRPKVILTSVVGDLETSKTSTKSLSDEEIIERITPKESFGNARIRKI